MLKVQNLQKSFGALSVISDVSFSLARGQKVALVGHNGTGKTTLLKIIAGIETQDSGSVEIASDVCIGYLPQDTSLATSESIINYLKKEAGIDLLEKELDELTLDLEDPLKASRYSDVRAKYEHLDGYSFVHKVKTILTGLGFNDIDLECSLSKLSSGQKSKIVLAGILLRGVDLLLLDEPTNNLDIPALIWLEDFLQKSEAACIIVSHDRKFLDRVVNKIFEIDWSSHQLNISRGIYSDYLMMKTKIAANKKEEYRIQQEEIERLTERAREKKNDAAKGSRWQGSDNDKFSRGFKRDQSAKSSKIAKSIEKRIDQMDKIEKPAERKPLEIEIESSFEHGNFDIKGLGVVFGYKGGFVSCPASFDIKYGSRVGIMGLNGAGKSTLLKTITNEIKPLEGQIILGSGVKIGNMAQEHEILPRKKTPLEFIVESTSLSRQEAYAKLVRFGFNKNQIEALIEILSPGGRARLILAMFSAQLINTLILDEPTNHLDIEVLDALEELLSSYKGTIIVVSHDRYFLEKLSLNTVFVLSNGNLSKISSYEKYIAMIEDQARKISNIL
ncbi:MAG TPA: ABC-F family ATP-binding cassette domain-containing protein [bacterium]|nr:ABC-F family ATP-binding cassette domain-containing protein [bacterium]